MTGETEKQSNGSLTEVVKTLIAVIEEKDEYIKGHSDRVAANGVRFSKKLGLPKGDIEKIYLSGLLHDIGFVYIPLEIIQKPGNLTEDELTIVKQHPIISEKILSKHSMFHGILPIVRHHHEAFDGNGYPDGLKGDEIPLGARILCLVNSYDTLISSRPHNSSMRMVGALEEIVKNAGRQFDGRLVKPFVEFINSDEGISGSAKEDEEEGTAKEVIQRILKSFESGDIDLPVLPKVIQEIQGVMNKPTSTMDELVRIIEKDGVISVKLITVVNSPLYRGTDRIYSVKQTIPRLGMKETQSIVMALANKSLFRTKRGDFKVLMESLWLHSLASAHSARSIAKVLQLDDLEQYFLMGLLHDIGKAALLKMLSEQVSQNDTLNRENVIACIQDVHTSFGGVLLKRWKFPPEFIQVATRHEGPTFSPSEEKGTLVVNLASGIASEMGYGISDNSTMDLPELASAKILEMDADIIYGIGDETADMMEEAVPLF